MRISTPIRTSRAGNRGKHWRRNVGSRVRSSGSVISTLHQQVTEFLDSQSPVHRQCVGRASEPVGDREIKEQLKTPSCWHREALFEQVSARIR